ncbi:MAG: (2Fe-2S)-binding protein [Deltaproteobacteria bacterium]|nr:(2Fe-2S)-binding protein [Deltaproteobacteria bacterium]
MPILNFRVNGKRYEVAVEPTTTLLEVLREKLMITSPKMGCNTGDCGTCSVFLDGKLIRSCITAAMVANQKEVTTLEGIAPHGEFDPLQQAFLENHGTQCGFCTPGMIMAAKALLNENPKPTKQEIKEALSGNLCRCTGYKKIVESVQAAATQKN